MTRIIAGPLSTQILGDMGAEVIKIERPDGGDDSRRVGPPWLKDDQGVPIFGRSTYFQAVNRNKRSISISFESDQGRQLLLKLLSDADIFVENFRPGTLSRYGLGYDQLRELNPRLIYCSISGFGQTGPYASRSGYDYLAQGMSGLMNVTGHPVDEPGGGPMRVGIPLVDIFAGMNAGLGILAALRSRDQTGQGQHIDISLFDSGVASMLNPVAAWFNSQEGLGLTGNDHPSAAPYGIFQVDDGYIIIATFSDREFVRLAAALGHPEWSDDPRFALNGARVANRALLKQLVTDALKGKTKSQWVEALNGATVSCGPINTMAELGSDPHVQARGLIVRTEHPLQGPIYSAANPIRMSSSPTSYRLAPPMPGEHTREILINLGLDEGQIAALVKAGVVELGDEAAKAD
jgi:crotonobetainyl-CoA:carnitine CoA-transferase CaiB-like acyl-CoA transferase